MPLYEYECLKNGHRFELIRKFSDPEVKVCIKCKSKVEKLLSAPAIAFKGSGWYVTDYARKGSGNGTEKSAKSDEKSETKSDDKPGSKPKKESKADSGGASSRNKS